MSNMKRDHFIAGGHGRLRDALKDEIEKIEKDIKLKYQPELNRAGFFKEIYLKYKMRKEIEREVDKIVPRGGLYLKNK